MLDRLNDLFHQSPRNHQSFDQQHLPTISSIQKLSKNRLPPFHLSENLMNEKGNDA